MLFSRVGADGRWHWRPVVGHEVHLKGWVMILSGLRFADSAHRTVGATISNRLIRIQFVNKSKMIHLSGWHLDLLRNGLLRLVALTFNVGLKGVRIEIIEIHITVSVRLQVDQWLIVSIDFCWMLLLLLDHSLIVMHLGQLIIGVLFEPLDR